MKTGKRLFLAAGVCLVLAAVFAFAAVGYKTTAFCLCVLAAILAFYGFMVRRGTKAARVLSILGAFAIALGLALFTVAEVPVLGAAHGDDDADAPYLIVMGAAVHGTTPSLSMVERTEAALAWLEAHPDGVAVVSGGQGPGEDMTEAAAMTEYLTARGVDPARIWQEPEAASSCENILFSLRVIADHGGDPAGRVALCSSEYHLCRMRYMAERLGCDPVLAAARTGHGSLRVNYFIREAFAMWKCWLFGVG